MSAATLIPVRPGRYRYAAPGELPPREGCVKPLSLRYIDPSSLASPPPAFNASIIRWHGRLVMAYRSGYGGCSRLHITELADDLTPPMWSWHLHFSHPWANVGQEDPRLFVHDSNLHVAFVGTEGPDFDHLQRTSILYGRLEGYGVKELFAPDLEGRWSNEKNWQWFSAGGALYAVYDILTHRIIRVDGDQAEFAYESPWSPRWTGGLMRGGASPVLVDGEFWCFFHGKENAGKPIRYSVGCYTFAAEPPFRPLRYTPRPLAYFDADTKPADEKMEIVFPCGATLEGWTWLVSCGMHDRQIGVYEFDHAAIEKAMVPA